MLVSIPNSKINASTRNLVDIEKSKEIHEPTSLKDLYHTSKETAKILKVSLQTLNEWRKEGIIVAHRIAGKAIRFKKTSIENALNKIKVIPFNQSQK